MCLVCRCHGWLSNALGWRIRYRNNSCKPSDRKTMNPKFELYWFFFFQGSVSLPRNNPLIFWPGSRKWVFYSCIYCIITHKIYMSSYAHFPFKPNEIVLCSLSYSLIFIDLNNKLQTFSHVNKFSFLSESLVAMQYALWILLVPWFSYSITSSQSQ